MMHATHLVIGGGSAGCVMAARLSEAPANDEVLLEVGRDYAPDQTPGDIRDTYSCSAPMNPNYFWKGLKVHRRADVGSVHYEQGRVLDGGSSVNRQVAVRGALEDYDHCDAIGAKSWDCSSVLPCFRRLDTNTVRRMPMQHRDDFTLSVTKRWNELRYPLRPNMNGEFGEGRSPLPLSNDGSARRSSAVGYLDATTRRCSNLQILGETQVRKVLFANRRASGAEVRRNDAVETITADNVIVSAGALHTPWLMASILTSDPVPQYMSNLFASKFSERVRNVSRKSFRNMVLTNAAALMMNSSAGPRRFLLDKVISDSPSLPELLADPEALERHLRDNAQSAWHASCTCRMGDAADARTVVDPSGKVVGADNLFVANASVIPEVSRTNTNFPTIMIAERIAEMVRQR
jgi:choline dehydrogenase-like flavoprotein